MASPDFDDDLMMSSELKEEDEVNRERSEQAGKSFWSIEYYQTFFDVDTQEVRNRIFSSFIPNYRDTSQLIKAKPDLYGPLWICITLILSITVCGNLNNYLQTRGSDYHWKYDYTMASYSAVIICIYVLLVPFLLWILFKSKGVAEYENTTPTFMELICLYGYSLFIFIPVSILWSIQINILHWLLILISAILSISVLLLRLTPAFRLLRCSIFYILGIVLCHFLVGSGIMLYFFHPSQVFHGNSTSNATALHANSTSNATVLHANSASNATVVKV